MLHPSYSIITGIQISSCHSVNCATRDPPIPQLPFFHASHCRCTAACFVSEANFFDKASPVIGICGTSGPSDSYRRWISTGFPWKNGRDTREWSADCLGIYVSLVAVFYKSLRANAAIPKAFQGLKLNFCSIQYCVFNFRIASEDLR